MNPGQMKDFGSIQVSDPRQSPLVQQSNFDFSAAGPQLSLQYLGSYNQRVRTDAVRTQNLFQSFLGKQANGTEAASVPIPDVANLSRETHVPTQVQLVGRFPEQHEARHARFHDDGVARSQANNDPFANPFDGDNFLADGPTPKNGAGRLCENCFQRTSQPIEPFNSPANNAQDTAPHGFDFGKLRHRSSARVSGHFRLNMPSVSEQFLDGRSHKNNDREHAKHGTEWHEHALDSGNN